MIAAIEKYDIKERLSKSTTTTHFMQSYNLNGTYKSFAIDFVQMSNSFYQMNSNYNVLKINFSAVDYTITITPGNYTSSELINAIKTGLQSVDAGFDCVLGPNTQLITISHTTTNFTLSLSQSTINKVLGFLSTNLTGAQSYTAPNYFNNSWPQIQIHSKALSYSSLNRTSWKSSYEYIDSIKLDGPPGEIIYYEPNEKKIFPFIVSGKTDIDLYFTDPYGNLITDMQKGIFIIQIIYYK